jgi:hypothetical protein
MAAVLAGDNILSTVRLNDTIAFANSMLNPSRGRGRDSCRAILHLPLRPDDFDDSNAYESEPWIIHIHRWVVFVEAEMKC